LAEIRGLIFDYGGVLWDMRWDLARTLEQEHRLRERTIVELRFFAEKTQTEIAEEVGISQMHVSRLLARTLIQLRERLETLDA